MQARIAVGLLAASFAVPASSAAVEVGERFRVGERCVTVKRVDGQQVEWAWKRGGARASGSLPASMLGEPCAGEASVGAKPEAAARPKPRVGATYVVKGHCATLTELAGGQASYTWVEGNRRGRGSLPVERVGAPCTHGVVEPVAPGAVPPGKTGAKLGPADIREIVADHNRERRLVGTPDLRWSAEVAAYAAEWAATLQGKGCGMEHRGSARNPKRLGENLAGVGQRHFPVSGASERWASEKADYSEGEVISRSNFQAVGHYTQMVWRGTAKVGCAVAWCGEDGVLVCNYDPAGNMLGSRPY